MKKLWKKSLYLCAATLMIGGVVAPSTSNNISASAHRRIIVNRHNHRSHLRHKRSHHYSKHHNRYHHRRHSYKRKHRHLTTKRIQKQMANTTLTDINRTRRRHGELPLSNTSNLNTLAGRRVRQIRTNFSHDGAPSDVGENIASTTLGNTSMAGDPHHYHNHNGKQMAREVMDSFMKYDGNQGNVHRDNILSDNYNSIGISVLKGKHGVFYLVEDFQ